MQYVDVNVESREDGLCLLLEGLKRTSQPSERTKPGVRMSGSPWVPGCLTLHGDGGEAAVVDGAATTHYNTLQGTR